MAVGLQVCRKASARTAKEMGWDKLVVVQPRQLPSSENMLAELFEVHTPAPILNQTSCKSEKSHFCSDFDHWWHLMAHDSYYGKQSIMPGTLHPKGNSAFEDTQSIAQCCCL